MDTQISFYRGFRIEDIFCTAMTTIHREEWGVRKVYARSLRHAKAIIDDWLDDTSVAAEYGPHAPDIGVEELARIRGGR